MKPFLLALFLLIAVAPRLYADDVAIAQQLEAAGGKVTRKDGAMTQVSFIIA